MYLHQFYIQKSKLILFPLLDLKHDMYMPHETYLSYEPRIKLDDDCLVCTYKRVHNEDYYNFRNTLLLKHPNFVKHVTTIDYDVIIFSLKHIKQDLESFKQGKYSELSKDSKNKILKYYSKSNLGFVLIDSHVNPEDYHDFYAKEYGIDLQIIQSTHETLDGPDMDREKL